MSIITVTEAKTLLNITHTKYDDRLTEWLPITQNDLLSVCNNFFKDTSVYQYSTEISFTSPDTLTDANSYFVENEFESGYDIVIEGSQRNDGAYEISTVTAGTITTTTENIVNEDAGFEVEITRIRWPSEIKKPFIKMLWYNINNIFDSGQTSINVGRYNRSLEQIIDGYPRSIIAGLSRWRNVRLG